MKIDEDKIVKLHAAGIVLKGDTLKGFRMLAGLTLKAFAGEMGIREDAYERLERDAWRVKHYHLKAALNVVRIMYLQAGQEFPGVKMTEKDR